MEGKYQPRKIEFIETVKLPSWQVKVYTISEIGACKVDDIWNKAKERLQEWLEQEKSYDTKHNKIAFLIIHSSEEGILSVVNWWYGLENLNTQIYLTNNATHEFFKKIPGDGSDPSDWEMEIILHERKSWVKNVLNKSHSPDYGKYLNDTYNGYF